MLKEDPGRIHMLLEEIYQQYNGSALQLLTSLLNHYGCKVEYDLDCLNSTFSTGKYLNAEHCKRVMPKCFWDMVFRNKEKFLEKEYFELLISIFKSCICPDELFYLVYNIKPDISGYLNYNEGTYHNGVYWNVKSKYIRLLSHANRNQAIRLTLLTMLTNPKCPADIKNKVASDPSMKKYYMVTNIATSNISVLSPILIDAEHTIPFTNDSENWWNPACSDKIVGDLFFIEMKLRNKLTESEKSILSLIEQNPLEEDLRILAENNQTYIRGMVANNKNCPDDVLVTLSVDEEFFVRYCCFCNINTPSEAFKKNIDKNFYMSDYLMMICHPNCPSDIVRIILNSNFSYVGYLSYKCPNLPEEIIEDRMLQHDCSNFLDLFCQKNCTISLIERLINNNNSIFSNAEFLANFTVFYYNYLSIHTQPQYKSSYNKEYGVFESNCRSELAFTSKMGDKNNFCIIDPHPLCNIDTSNHARLKYDINYFISNKPL